MSETIRPDPEGKELATLSLAANGIVFGDIGTSPIYALRESFHPSHGVEASPDHWSPEGAGATGWLSALKLAKDDASAMTSMRSPNSRPNSG